MNAIVSESLANRQRAGSAHSSADQSDAGGEPVAPKGERGATPRGRLAPSKFAEVYQEHSRAIYYLSLRLLSDPEKAEDATHDVFLKAFKRHRGGDPSLAKKRQLRISV